MHFKLSALAVVLAASSLAAVAKAAILTSAQASHLLPPLTGNSWPKGKIISFFIDYSVAGPLIQYANATNGGPFFQAWWYEKTIFDDPAKAIATGLATYNIQIFEQDLAAGVALADYQSVQNFKLADNKGTLRDVFVYINGRLRYTLVPNGGGFPAVVNAKIVSIAGTQVEADGIVCSNVGVNPMLVDPANPQSVTRYVIDLRKATCVPQVVSG